MRRRTVHPRATLLLGGTQHTLSALQRLNIQIGNVGITVGAIARTTGESETDLELVIEHHLVFPQTALAIKDTQHALLGLHAAAGAPPGLGVVAAVIAATGWDSAGGLGGMLGDGIPGADNRAGGGDVPL